MQRVATMTGPSRRSLALIHFALQQMGFGYVHEDLQITVDNAITDATAITISEGANTGKPAVVASGTLTTAASLYRVLHGHGYTGYKVTESATATTFQYVSQCSNRGSCDSSTGICKCFKGYSNDNCDNQNMLAM